jgi:hypothetical protein
LRAAREAARRGFAMVDSMPRPRQPAAIRYRKQLAEAVKAALRAALDPVVAALNAGRLQAFGRRNPLGQPIELPPPASIPGCGFVVTDLEQSLIRDPDNPRGELFVRFREVAPAASPAEPAKARPKPARKLRGPGKLALTKLRQLHPDRTTIPKDSKGQRVLMTRIADELDQENKGNPAYSTPSGHCIMDVIADYADGRDCVVP